MPSDEKRLKDAFRHILEIKEGEYPTVQGERIVERPWQDVPESSKLAILQDAVNWEGVSDRDQAHILLSEIDPGKISDSQRRALIEAATRNEQPQAEQARERGGRER